MSLSVYDPVSFLTGIFDNDGGGENDPFHLAAGPFMNHELRVLSFRGRERVNDVYRYEVVFATQQPIEALQVAVFGIPACLTIKAPGHEPRVIQGLVSSLEALGAVPGERGTKRRRYRIEIVPRLWLLKHGRKNRIFQNKTPKEIIEEILSGYKIRHEDCNWRIRVRDYPKLPFVYQRAESNYDFFRRVLDVPKGSQGEPQPRGYGRGRSRDPRRRESRVRKLRSAAMGWFDLKESKVATKRSTNNSLKT